MRHLLLVAHGSRRAASNEEVRELAARLEAVATGRFGAVHAAFLELEEPSIPEAIERCIARGATEITVLPYFLSRGRHVVTDVPEQVEPKRQQHPAVRITVSPHLGASDGIAALLLQLAG